MMTRLRFQVKRWRAWLPVELRPERVSSRRGGLVSGLSPDVSFLPLMQRRRLTPMAKAVVAAAWPCLHPQPEIPVVSCSLHGETRYGFEILTALAKGEELSPTRFALSGHGAMGGLMSQLIPSRAPFPAIAPGSEGYSAALLEVAGLMLPGSSNRGETRPHEEAMVLWYEQPLPSVYHPYAPDPPGVMALAVRLASWRGEEGSLTVKRLPGKGPESGRDPLLTLIRGFCAGAGCWDMASASVRWHWLLDNA